MPRLNNCLNKKRKDQSDGRYNLVIQIGELIVIQGRNTDRFYGGIGHVIDITHRRYRILIRNGPIILRIKTQCYNRIRGQGQSLQKHEFPYSHPAPIDYIPPAAYEDRFAYKHGTEYSINSDSEDSSSPVEFSDSDSDTYYPESPFNLAYTSRREGRSTDHIDLSDQSWIL